MKKILLLTTLVLLGDYCVGQYYRNSVGIRLGGSTGVTYKSFQTESGAYEILASGRNDGFQITALYESYLPTKLSQNLFVYYGVGAHVGFEKYEGNQVVRAELSNTNPGTVRNVNVPKYFSMGIDAIAGLEYRFTAPITLGINVKPRFSFIGMRFTNLEFWDAALTFSFLI